VTDLHLWTIEECRCFELIDSYARREHRCFLVEMFAAHTDSKYLFCFRPTQATRSSANLCRYLTIAAEEVKMIEFQESLPMTVRQKLTLN